MIMMIVTCVLIFFTFVLWMCCLAGKRADEAMDEIYKAQSKIEG